MGRTKQIGDAMKMLHYLAPLVIFLGYLVAASISVCTLQTLKKSKNRTPRRCILLIVSIVLLTYIGEATVFFYQLSSNAAALPTTDRNFYVLSSILIWLILLAILGQSDLSVWYPYYICWSLFFAVESTSLGLGLAYQRPSKAPERAQISIQILRICLLIVLPTVSFYQNASTWRINKLDEESAPLLAHLQNDSEDSQLTKTGPDYGSTTRGKECTSTPANSTEQDDEAKERQREEAEMKILENRLRSDGNWWTYLRGFSLFIPLVWPSKRRALQLNLVGVCICLLLLRGLNVLMPRQLGIVVNALGQPNGSLPFFQLGLYLLYLCAQSGAGIQLIQSLLWAPVEFNAEQATKSAAFNHIMSLSCDFHDSKSSGEIHRAMYESDAVIDLMNILLFQLLPELADLSIACAYLYYLFDVYMALIVAASIVTYLLVSQYTATWQSDCYRRNVITSRAEYSLMYDTMGSWKTVTYFNRLEHEQQRYDLSVGRHMQARRVYWTMASCATGAQSLVLKLGLFGACVFAAAKVLYGDKNVGDFVTLLTFWAQLSSPLQFFGSMYRDTQNKLIATEKLLELFRTTPSIKDGPFDFKLTKGEVQFNHVGFSYDGKKQILKDLDFSVAPGQTIALVGETGGGKSTILKLLFRFYDATEGRILIDGQMLTDVTLKSLREHIGIVPQDPSLFNDTIMSNVRYSRLDATDAEVINACKAAAIHDKILSFTNGYSSKVGERGVKLSGGELQRVAIARAILKDPRIVLLDEATSSVDTETEEKIQEALSRLTKGRTTFIVAHRLSTVTKADLILVIKDGAILEKGTPQELLRAKGKYYRLWTKQVGIRDPLEEEKESSQQIDSTDQHNCVDNEGVETSEQSKGKGLERRDGSENVSCSQGSLGSLDKKTFRPDAPEFVPQSHREPVHKSDEEGLAQDRANVSQDISTTKDKRQRNRKRKSSAHLGVVESIEGKDKAVSSSKGPARNEPTKATEPKTKRTRFTRRNQSKSEPSGQSLQRSQGDGTSEVDTTPEASGEGPPSMIPRRRITVPNAPSSATGDAKLAQRRRRHRNWRAKKRDASGTTQSGSQSTRPSADWSADSPQPNTPPPGPATSPASGIMPSNQLGALPSANTVRFTLDK